ncbi:UNVERIFIED_CONTAM: hypothetical protein Sangu_1554700 [Sesamum angustifolium]|uniref:NAA35-like TPR repeats domain-containing protein n=1 Tax=Sesamum angustifolium TaxID=2727405 RepID=A0AAW2MTG3_9LAMI
MRRPQGKGLELAKKHIISCLCELDSMLKSAEFLRDHCACGTLEDGVEDKTTASGCQPIGFDSTLNSRSAAPTPPRAIKLLSWTKAVNYFQKLLHDLDIICSYSLDPVFEGALRFVVDFQKFQPDLVARAYIQGFTNFAKVGFTIPTQVTNFRVVPAHSYGQLLLVQEGKLYGREPMFAVICRAALLPEGAKNHDVQKNETVGQLGQVGKSFGRLANWHSIC